MILSDYRISELRSFLTNWPDETPTTFPGVKCTCEACHLSKNIGMAKRPLTSIQIKVVIRKALALQERFGQCDFDLLKELCKGKL